ncbi:MAG: gamma subclass chorismate mutase AroQ [Chthoniobacterales bacterium]|nr:gamma subclass chorismate mutase AroQ [Chthoniobacterales bacterium]
MKHAFPLMTAVLLAACSSPGGELVSLAQKRLALARDIAWYKYSRELPVYDATRETALLQAVIAEGTAAGVPPETTRRFFAAEMEASRRIQWEWIHAWRKNLAPLPEGTPPDLSGNLRPQIDSINSRQIQALSRGAQPPSINQLSDMGARFLPKN